MADFTILNEPLRELALFAGAGGGILGGHLLGWRTVCAVENNPYAAGVLAQRQNDGLLAPFPIWDDVCTFDGKPWRGLVDVVSGGFPCQGVSAAGAGLGMQDERSGLWSEMARIVDEVRPSWVFVENSPILTSRGLGTVLADLAQMGFDAEWCCVGADSCGMAQKRERFWCLAYSNEIRRDAPRQGEIHSQLSVKTNFPRKTAANREANLLAFREWYSDDILSRNFRRTDDVACRVDRLEAIGNGQIPTVAAVAWSELRRRINE